MIKYLLVFVLTIAGFMPSQAQIKLGNTQQLLNALNARSNTTGTLIGILANQVKPNLLSSNFRGNLSNWTRSLNGKNDLPILKGALSQLAAGLLPQAFNSSWANNSSRWLQNVNGASRIADLAPLILQFQSAINPNAFNNQWVSQMANWSQLVRRIK